jgi:hypothetical protein
VITFMAAADFRPGPLTRLADHPLARVVAYYVVLTVGLVLLYQWRPDLPGVFTTGRFDQLQGVEGFTRSAAPTVSIGVTAMVKEALIAMVGAYLLMLPVAWVYVFTRAKRGYQQSLVQTLIILPIVVAGVVILVKNSVALAFSLGGIVGAIAFRNRLEDTKDAVHVFLAIGVGLGAGVQVMAVAAALSVFYNLINVVLWWTDFGRVPASLEGPVAQRRLAMLRNRAGRSDAFVSQVDTLLLKSMSPEQLEVLAERARKRRVRLAEQIGMAVTGELRRPRFDGTVRIVASGNPEALKPLVEPVLTGQAKAWWLEAATVADAGRATLLYKVRFKKTIPGPLLVEAVRRAVAGKVSSVELL